MKPILSERNIVVVLFVMVLITFSLAQEDSKKMEEVFLGTNPPVSKPDQLVKNEEAGKKDNKEISQPAAYKE